MKRISLYIMTLVAMVLAACEGPYDDWAAPQGFDPENPTEVDFKVTPNEDIDMSVITDTIVQVFTPTITMPEGYELEGYTATLDSLCELPVMVDGTTSVKSLIAAVESLYGKAPYPREMELKVWAHMSKGDQKFVKAAKAGTITVTLNPPYISEHYYLIGAPPSEWSTKCTKLPFIHSDEDVYDDPYFTIIFKVSAGDTWFAVIDDKTIETDDWKYVYGCCEGNGKNGLVGQLNRRSELQDDGSWMYHADNETYVKMTLDMLNYTYTLEELNFSPFVYLPGSHNGWSFTDKLLGNNEGNYNGFAVIGGEWGWKVTTQDNWDETYGSDGQDGLMMNGGNIMEGSSPTPYWAEVNLADLTYNLTEVTSMSLIGTVQGNWDTDVDMTWDAEGKCWTVTANLNAGEFKIRMNHDWSISLGGTPESLTTQNGANIPLAEAGNYTIKLYPSYDGDSHCTISKN